MRAVRTAALAGLIAMAGAMSSFAQDKELTQLAATFDAAVHLRVGDGGDWINAKSIVKVMKLKARTRETLFFRAQGIEADRAVRELIDLVERRFDEPAA